MKKFFTYNDILNFKAYAEAETVAQKECIYTKHLYPFIEYQISAILKAMNTSGNRYIMQNYEDLKQDLHLHIYQKVLNTIDVSRINAIQNYIYLSVKNQLINILESTESRTNIQYDNNNYKFTDEDIEIDGTEYNHDMIIQMINSKLDDKINQQINVNCVASVYLQLLKEYILKHDYNSEGFKEHCMKAMNIKDSQFLNLSYKFGFKTIAFKTKKQLNTINQ